MTYKEVLLITETAWNATKDEADPLFDACALSHKETLIAKTEGVVSTGIAEGDFEKAVLEQLKSVAVEEPETEVTAPVSRKKPKGKKA